MDITTQNIERNARIDRALGQAIKDGRISFAEKAQWEPRLRNPATFANELQVL